MWDRPEYSPIPQLLRACALIFSRSTRAPAAERLHQLEEDHLRGVGPPRAELEDAGVSALSLGVARCDLLEQLVDDELVLPEARHGEPPGVLVALLAERDQPLELRLDRLGLGLGGLDALMIDDLAREVHH